MNERRPSLDQRRARHAWLSVQRALKLNKPADYSREAKHLPVRIKTSGLGQAIAFLNAKAKEQKDDARNALLCDLGDWLLVKRHLGPAGIGDIKRNSIIETVVNGDSRLLRLATDEAMHYLQWLTRFAEAEIPSDED